MNRRRTVLPVATIRKTAVAHAAMDAPGGVSAVADSHRPATPSSAAMMHPQIMSDESRVVNWRAVAAGIRYLSLIHISEPTRPY